MQHSNPNPNSQEYQEAFARQQGLATSSQGLSQYLPSQYPNASQYAGQHNTWAAGSASSTYPPSQPAPLGYFGSAPPHNQGLQNRWNAGGYPDYYEQIYDRPNTVPQLPNQRLPTNNASGATRSPPEVHNYVRLPSTAQETIDTYIKIVRLPDTEENQDASARSKRAYQCTVPNCEKAARGEVFKSKDNARVHVHKHFGSEKLFRCVVCPQAFGSEDAAKRHRDTTDSRAYRCAICGNYFARKDYRDSHQGRCGARE